MYYRKLRADGLKINEPLMVNEKQILYIEVIYLFLLLLPILLLWYFTS
jgi:hypothetical protein